MEKKILVWGAGSKARIALGMLARAGDVPSLLFDPTLDVPAFETQAPFSAEKAVLQQALSDCTHFLVCVGGEHGYARHHLFCALQEKGLRPLPLISTHAVVDVSAVVGDGFQAMPGSVLHCYAQVGDACIVNSNATVDHECTLGHGVHVMGGASVAGRVTVGDYVSIGTNATVLPDLHIGAGAYIGAGAVVTQDVGENQVVVGNPARVTKTRVHQDPDIDTWFGLMCDA